MATEAESAVRAYLDALASSAAPKRTVDREAVRALQAQIKATDDVIEKLRLHAALEEERQGRTEPEVDRAALEAGFVAVAKAWAEEEGITASAFQALRVPDDVLTAAGFEVEPAAPRPTQSSGGSRAPRLALSEVRAAIAQLPHTWRVTELAERLDRDVNTTRNYLTKLVEEGTVSVLGDDPAHSGRGRAPKLYARQP
jgi:hypothetical protein